MGIGIGMIISTLILFLSGTNKMSNAEIEKAFEKINVNDLSVEDIIRKALVALA